MSNPMLAKLKGLTKSGGKKPATKPADSAAEPEAKTKGKPAKPAKAKAAPAKDAKNLSPLERMKAGMTKGKAKSKGKKPSAKPVEATDSAPTADPESTAAAPVEPATGVNPPAKKKRGRKPSAKTATAAASSTSDSDKSGAAKPAKAPAKSKKAKVSSVLLIGCYPVKGFAQPTQLYELLDDVKQAVCEANNVPHWGLIEYGKADASLAQALEAKFSEEDVPPVLYAEPFSSETRAVEQVLLKYYDTVLRGLR